MGQGQLEDLALLNSLQSPLEPRQEIKNVVSSVIASLLLPRPHFQDENVPGAAFGCHQVRVPAEELHRLLQGAVLSSHTLMELQGSPSGKRSNCDPG